MPSALNFDPHSGLLPLILINVFITLYVHISTTNPSGATQYIPAGDDHSFLSVPGRVVGHDLGVRGDVLW